MPSSGIPPGGDAANNTAQQRRRNMSNTSESATSTTTTSTSIDSTTDSSDDESLFISPGHNHYGNPSSQLPVFHPGNEHAASTGGISGASTARMAMRNSHPGAHSYRHINESTAESAGADTSNMEFGSATPRISGLHSFYQQHVLHNAASAATNTTTTASTSSTNTTSLTTTSTSSTPSTSSFASSLVSAAPAGPPIITSNAASSLTPSTTAAVSHNDSAAAVGASHNSAFVPVHASSEISQNSSQPHPHQHHHHHDHAQQQHQYHQGHQYQNNHHQHHHHQHHLQQQQLPPYPYSRQSSTSSTHSSSSIGSGGGGGGSANGDHPTQVETLQYQNSSFHQSPHHHPHNPQTPYFSTTSSQGANEYDDLDDDDEGPILDDLMASSFFLNGNQPFGVVGGVPAVLVGEDETVGMEAVEEADRLLSGDGIENATLKDLQEAINVSHPFGLKIWKPALYKKSRTIEAISHSALHSDPSHPPISSSDPDGKPPAPTWWNAGNILWAVLFGWWAAAIYILVALLLVPFASTGFICMSLLNLFTKPALRHRHEDQTPLLSSSRRSKKLKGWRKYLSLAYLFSELERTSEHIKLLLNLAGYVFWPFGKFVAKRRLHSSKWEPPRLYVRSASQPSQHQQQHQGQQGGDGSFSVREEEIGERMERGGELHPQTPMVGLQGGTPSLAPPPSATLGSRQSSAHGLTSSGGAVVSGSAAPPKLEGEEVYIQSDEEEEEEEEEEGDLEAPRTGGVANEEEESGAVAASFHSDGPTNANPTTISNATTAAATTASNNAAPLPPPKKHKRFLKRLSQSGLAGMLFSILVILFLGPLHLLCTGACFLGVFSVPMAKLNFLLLRHLWRHPLKISAHWSSEGSLKPEEEEGVGVRLSGDVGVPPSPLTPRTPYFAFDAVQREAGNSGSSVHVGASGMTPAIAAGPSGARCKKEEGGESSYMVVLCIYNALGWEYYKYTYEGINILFLNLLALVVFTLFDFYFIGPLVGYKGIASHYVLFFSALLSVIPLAYLIGMAVSSITAQTGSLALGAVVNATFGSVVEIILYCLALMEGKTRMVEGAIVGSFMAGLLALPGASMFSGGLKRKEQRFNSKSATVTSTMLILSIIGAFGPTLFQEVYGTFEMTCEGCPVVPTSPGGRGNLQCHTCRYRQPHPTLDPIYIGYTRPLMYRCATALVLIYAIGLWFTLRTHAKRIYPPPKPKKENRRDLKDPYEFDYEMPLRNSIHLQPHMAPLPPPALAVPSSRSLKPHSRDPSNTRRERRSQQYLNLNDLQRASMVGLSPRVSVLSPGMSPRLSRGRSGSTLPEPGRDTLVNGGGGGGGGGGVGLGISSATTVFAAVAGEPAVAAVRKGDKVANVTPPSRPIRSPSYVPPPPPPPPHHHHGGGMDDMTSVGTSTDDESENGYVPDSGRLGRGSQEELRYRRNYRLSQFSNDASVVGGGGGNGGRHLSPKRRMENGGGGLTAAGVYQSHADGMNGGRRGGAGGASGLVSPYPHGQNGQQGAGGGANDHGHGGGGEAGHGAHGGHDNPNWSTGKSAVVLLVATVMFSLIAEVLIDSVDFVIDTGGGGGNKGGGLPGVVMDQGNADSKFILDEKILGLTLFALVPTVTEFYNAIAFAQMGNIALSLEIGSAYTIQVALLQIPALVAFSAYWRIYGHPPRRSPPSDILLAAARDNDKVKMDPSGTSTPVPFRMFYKLLSPLVSSMYASIPLSPSSSAADTLATTTFAPPLLLTSLLNSHRNPIVEDTHQQIPLPIPPAQDTFSLVFPRWDLVAVIISVFTLTYLYIEGKSNYFKGAMLLMAYGILMSAFFYAPNELERALTYAKDLYNATDFKPAGVSHGARIYVKDSPGASSLPITKGAVTFPPAYTVDDIRNSIKHFDGRKVWDGRFESAQEVETYSDSAGLIHSLQKGQWPVVSGRDFAVAYCTVLEGSTYIVVQTSVSTPKIKEVKGRVRGTIIAAAWFIEPSKSVEGGWDVTYITHADPAGTIPGALVRLVATETPACAGSLLEYLNKHGPPS
ncbi:hypothetical protein HDV05_000765 [Chytridiales sp. JEL 0842]|nr:hypothetical protein HDV05_000765 [Chytridiales sp. JEL 0842]